MKLSLACCERVIILQLYLEMRWKGKCAMKYVVNGIKHVDFRKAVQAAQTANLRCVDCIENDGEPCGSIVFNGVRWVYYLTFDEG